MAPIVAGIAETSEMEVTSTTEMEVALTTEMVSKITMIAPAASVFVVVPHRSDVYSNVFFLSSPPSEEAQVVLNDQVFVEAEAEVTRARMVVVAVTTTATVMTTVVTVMKTTTAAM